jgi:hypothetical protein
MHDFVGWLSIVVELALLALELVSLWLKVTRGASSTSHQNATTRHRRHRRWSERSWKIGRIEHTRRDVTFDDHDDPAS